MNALLGQLAAAQRAGQAQPSSVPADYLARIRQAFASKPAGLGLRESLTERELEVLRLIAAGRSNQRITRDLTVALDTTKKHVSHILAKLGAANRTEAVARARELGLIP